MPPPYGIGDIIADESEISLRGLLEDSTIIYDVAEYSSRSTLNANKIYIMRGWDDSALNFVQWQSSGTPNQNPTLTSPVLVGNLINVAIAAVI